jgi:hypothetical protein
LSKTNERGRFRQKPALVTENLMVNRAARIAASVPGDRACRANGAGHAAGFKGREDTGARQSHDDSHVSGRALCIVKVVTLMEARGRAAQRQRRARWPIC